MAVVGGGAFVAEAGWRVAGSGRRAAGGDGSAKGWYTPLSFYCKLYNCSAKGWLTCY